MARKKSVKVKAHAKAEPPKAPPIVPEPPAKPKLTSVFDLFRPSAMAMRLNFGTIFWLVILPMLVSVPFFFILLTVASTMGMMHRGYTLANGILFAVIVLAIYLAMIVFATFTGIGLLFATLQSADGEKTTLKQALQAGRPVFWKILGLFFCTVLVVGVGLVLLIVPGLFMLKRYFLAPYYLIDRKLGVFEAMRQSAADAAKTGGIWGLLAIALIIGALPLIPYVGWCAAIIASVFYLCAPAIRYREVRRAVGQER